MTLTSAATDPRRTRLGRATGSAVLLLTVLAGCAAAGPTGDAVDPAAALPFPTSVTTPTPQTLPLRQPVADPAPPGSPDPWGGGVGPEVAAVMEMDGVSADEARRRLLAQQAGSAWSAAHGQNLDYWQIERDPYRFVAGTRDPDVELPATVAGYPVVLERSLVTRDQLQDLRDLVTTALRNQPSASGMDVRAATVEVWISHEPAVRALTAIADQVAAMAPAVLVVHYSAVPPRAEPPSDAASILRFPAVLGGASPAALVVGRLTIGDDGCVRIRSSTGDQQPLAVADYLDLVVTPTRVLVDGVDLGPPGEDGPVLALGGGFFGSDSGLADDNPGLERCVDPGGGFHAFSIDLWDGPEGGWG